ncbi:UNVERIFIED_CONTAM: hypothetical protein PYX00_005182 [Menopon gallinae]|uniref:cGMP-dependent protein kinase n=1 Tax=Menopon gallinae TaxID=328185 RepID=A0AAW2HQ89_9NEOP
MKFTWKPPFLVSAGQFDLEHSGSNSHEILSDLIIYENNKASYRMLKEHELLNLGDGRSEMLQNDQKCSKPDIWEKTDEKHEAKKPSEIHDLKSIEPNKNCSVDRPKSPQIDTPRSAKPYDTEIISNQKRIGVSAESTDHVGRNYKKEKNGNGSENLNSNDIVKIPKYEKNKESEELIRSAIMNNEFLREGLGDKEVMQAVVDAMYMIDIPEDSYVIKEGDIGSCLYVCAKGTVEVYKDGKRVNTLGPGKIFGELALLCNARRNATIKAITPCTFWKLDRKIFNQIVKIVGTRRIEEHVRYLRSVPVLSKLENDVLRKMTDLLKVGIFPAGKPIVREGEEGNLFYIITAGTVVVTKKSSDGSEKVVGKLGEGNFFGEQALIAKERRAATVTAQTQVECLTLDRKPFIEYLGGLEEVRKVVEARSKKKDSVKEKTSEYSHIKLQDLDLKGTLGIGGFGRVELVQYKKDPELVFALKKLKKSHTVAYGQQAHVLNEKHTMICCQSPFIVRLYSTYKDNKYIYFLMEPCLGGDVWSLLQKKKYFDEKMVKFITACIVEAFHYLHDRGIVYRDLKPENLVFNADGYVKLADFGFAKKLSSGEKTWTFAGTPEYVAPEIISNKGHDRAVDYWALGIFIYELLVGKPPFRGADHMATYQLILKGISSATFPPFISKPAKNLIKQLCKSVPAERLGYQKNGVDGIKYDKWFDGFNWEALEKMQMRAPFQPKINGPIDTSNFDECPKDKEIPPDEFGDWSMDF